MPRGLSIGTLVLVEFAYGHGCKSMRPVTPAGRAWSDSTYSYVCVQREIVCYIWLWHS